MTTIALTPKLAIVLVLAACVFLFAGCASIPNAGDAADQRVFLELKHQRQGTDLCVPTSASMILAYYGEDRSPNYLKSIATKSIASRPGYVFPGTYGKDMVSGLRKLGYRWEEGCFSTDAAGFRQGLSELKRSVRDFRPVMVGLFDPPIGHVVVLVGIDDAKRNLTFIDPNKPSPGLRTMREEDFRRNWRENIVNSRCAIFTRPKG